MTSVDILNRRRLLAAGLAVLLGQARSGAAMALPLPFRPVRRRTPDILVVTHERKSLRWKSQIVDSARTAVVGLTFLGCTSQCPPSDMLFQQLDAQAGDAIDLYTLTLAPLSDDWRQMASSAERMGASLRWRWLTGEPADIFQLLGALEIDYGDIERHGQSIFRAGRGRLDRIDRLPDVADLLASLT